MKRKRNRRSGINKRNKVIDHFRHSDGSVRCRYCGRRLTRRVETGPRKPFEDLTATVDHIIPKIRGGTNRYGNLQILCVKCNMLKGDQMED